MPTGKQVIWFVATSEEWAEGNDCLEPNYIGLESDTGLIKLGNGSSAWNDLRYVGGDKSISDAAKDLAQKLQGEEEVDTGPVVG